MKALYKLFFATALLTTTAACDQKREESPAADGGCIRVTATACNGGVEEIRAILERGRAAVDSVKRPIIGEAEHALEKHIPESPLMNFAADALLETAIASTGEKIDIAVTNKGGLRSNIAAGTITFGDIYNVFPFENTLALLTLNGEQLQQLCEEIAAVGGEAISGMRLEISADGKLLKATVDGKPIEKEEKYRIATSDYLSEGNDKLTALALGTERVIKRDITIRNLMVEYIKSVAAKGKKLSAECDGRITIIK